MHRIPDDPEAIAAAPGLKRLSIYVTLTVATLLALAKFGGWILTDSMALLAAAIDALVDAGASIVTLLGVTYAQKPPDRDHRFGHGKGEAVAAFTQATFLAGAAATLAFQAVGRLFSPVAVESVEIGVWVIIASLIAAGGLVTLQTYVVRKTGSTAIKADRAHYATDIAFNSAVLVALAVTEWTGWTRADPIFALGIAGYMLWSAYGIVGEALEQLLDRELPSGERRRIKEAVRACAGVRDIHDLRTRFSGDRTFVEYHLEVDPGMSVVEGHAIGDATETAVQGLLPGAVEATAHIEPHGIADERLDDAVAQSTP
jgi:ferrous-iron efflux pump FieF